MGNNEYKDTEVYKDTPRTLTNKTFYEKEVLTHFRSWSTIFKIFTVKSNKAAGSGQQIIAGICIFSQNIWRIYITVIFTCATYIMTHSNKFQMADSRSRDIEKKKKFCGYILYMNANELFYIFICIFNPIQPKFCNRKVKSPLKIKKLIDIQMVTWD